MSIQLFSSYHFGIKDGKFTRDEFIAKLDWDRVPAELKEEVLK